MSQYKDFTSDFPRRCEDLLDSMFRHARNSDREVTLVLMAAWGAFVVPFERLKPPERDQGEHAAGDRARCPDAAASLEALLAQKFLVSPLAPEGGSSWSCGELKSVEGGPDAWPELCGPKPMSRDKTVRGVLKLIRNGLAHGNIFTTGGREIEHLILIASVDGTPKCNFVRVSPEDFRKFVKAWVGFLRSSHIPVETAYEVISRAA